MRVHCCRCSRRCRPIPPPIAEHWRRSPTGASDIRHGRRSIGDGSHPGEFGGGAGLFLDVSGCAHLFGGEEVLLRDLLTRLEGLGFAATAAIAETAGAAWAMARFGGERIAVLPEGAVAAALEPLPVRGLRLPADIAAALQRIGLRRIGDLLPLPRAPLTARFGDVLLRRLDQATGHLDEPLSPRLPPPLFRARLAFAEPIGRTGRRGCRPRSSTRRSLRRPGSGS